MESTDLTTIVTVPIRPVLIAYDGSELAAHAVAEAGAQLSVEPRGVDARAPVDIHRGVDALVLCVWQPADVGFIPRSQHLNAASAIEVKHAAEETAAYGVALAELAGFRAQSLTTQAAPIWQGIIAVAEARHVRLIVLGSRHRSGLGGHLLGSVATSVLAHARSPVLIVSQPS